MTSVLVVDDSAADRKLAGGLLERQLAIAVSFATDGADALRHFDRHVPEIVVTDLVMPGMNGLELIETVRKEYPLTPVVMMTSRGSEEIAVMALEKGAASYVPKRILNQRLPETVERILAASREDRMQTRLMSRLVANESTFLLENDIILICSLARHLQQCVRGVGVCDEAEQIRTGVAIEEALLNALYHGNLEIDSELREYDDARFHQLARQRCQEPRYRDRQIFVKVKYSETEAVVVIRDEGQGFDIMQLPDPGDPESIRRPSGRGLLLMRAFMDEVHFNDVGNEVTMIKRRNPK